MGSNREKLLAAVGHLVNEQEERRTKMREREEGEVASRSSDQRTNGEGVFYFILVHTAYFAVSYIGMGLPCLIL